MPYGEIHVGDTDTALVVRVVDESGAAVDVSAASVRRILLRRPGGTLLTRAAVNDTTGTDGKIRYQTAAADLDVPGQWAVQGYVEVGSAKFHTAWEWFPVEKNLD